MEYILIEKFIFESIIARLKDCASEVAKLKQNFGVKPLDDWIDNQTAQRLLKRGQRTLQTLRSTGKLGVNNNEIGKQRYITDNQLAEKLHVSKRTLANYRAKGEIGYYDLPGKLLYEEAEIDGFLRKYYLPPFH